MNLEKAPCPHCGALAIREGASKCPACKRWVGTKPRAVLAPLQLFLASLGLMGAGAVAGALGAFVALAPRVPGFASHEPSAEATSASAPIASASSAASSESPAGSASSSAMSPTGAAPNGDAKPAKAISPFGAPKIIKLDFSPVDAVISADDASVFVLGDDGSLHAFAIDDGHALHKVSFSGRPTELRLLGDGRVATIGGSGPLQLVDPTSWALSRLEVGGAAVDVIEVGNPRVLVVGSSARRLSRFSPESYKPMGQVTLTRTITGLAALDGGGATKLGVLEQGKRGGPAGAIEFLDPTATPFAGARTAVSLGVEPRRGVAHEVAEALFIADHGSAQVLEVAPEKPPRNAPAGKNPIGSFLLSSRWVVTLDAEGTAFVADARAGRLDATSTIELGSAVSRAAVTPDGKALLVALGGGPKDRGDTTVVLAGDPPVLIAKLDTGAGSHSVTVSASGKRAVVAASAARSIAILAPAP